MTYISMLPSTSFHANTPGNSHSSNASMVPKNDITVKDHVLIQGEVMIQHLGRSVLGEETISQWKKNGLEIDNGTIAHAFEQMNKALNELGGKAGKAAFNSYQIVKSVQDVPGWFHEEHLKSLSNIQDPAVKKRFQSGDLYVTQRSKQYNPVNLYTSVSGL